MLTPEQRELKVREGLSRYRPAVRDFSHEGDGPRRAVGHAQGVAISRSIVRSYRRDHRRESSNVEPQQVIDVLRVAGVERWVLMGLYGYAGYLANPRATQDVNILVAEEELERTVEALSERWPKLEIERLEVVVRFRDPGEVAAGGQMQPVIDVMIPSNACHAAILADESHVDPSSQHRIPRLEAACASKFAALVSPFRDWDRKQQDAVDFRNLVLANLEQLDHDKLRRLGELIYEGGGQELLEFVQLTRDRRPFPV